MAPAEIFASGVHGKGAGIGDRDGLAGVVAHRIAMFNVAEDGGKPSTPVADELEPIPVSETVCAPVERWMVSEPVRVPAAAGMKVIDIVQLPPTAMEDARVVVSA